MDLVYNHGDELHIFMVSCLYYIRQHCLVCQYSCFYMPWNLKVSKNKFCQRIWGKRKVWLIISWKYCSTVLCVCGNWSSCLGHVIGCEMDMGTCLFQCKHLQLLTQVTQGCDLFHPHTTKQFRMIEYLQKRI